ncbi:deoxyribodipyrimidine photo-lyase [Nostoc sp. CCY 9925]|uniref:deoxyribodipyrimidine photo-lyase n=1 Tax=Nostoc sp. CCY 9925 TaxID=3103865 RepID=UPI0039C69198
MHLLWFRRDLRLTDNEIVTLATDNGVTVKPFFIIDPWFYTWADVGAARVRFLFESLENLDSNLQKLGSRLYLFEGNSTDIVQALTRQLIIAGYKPKLFFNRDVQVEYGVSRDKTIIDFYKQLNLDYHIGLNNFLQSTEQRDEWFNQYYTYQRQSQFSDTFRIYNPSKNIAEKDPQGDFIYYWIPSLKGYSLPEIEQGKYIDNSNYPRAILDWSKTRKVNGKVVSDLRKQTKQRLLSQGGDEYDSAITAKETVEKYWQHKDREYKEYQQKLTEVQE